MRLESSLLIKESMRLEAALGGVEEALVSRLTTAHACRQAAEYVIPLTLKLLMMMFTVLSRVGSIG